MRKARTEPRANLRRNLAYLAARSMAEGGITDLRRRNLKAARQLGLTEANILLDNQEIEDALRSFQRLYQSQDQPLELRRPREIARDLMREFSAFRPFLVGPVLSGTANQYSEVQLEVYTDGVLTRARLPELEALLAN